MGRSCSENGYKRNEYKILGGKPEGKRPLERSRCRWVDNIKMVLRGIVWDGVDWMNLVQDRDHQRSLVKTVMNLRFPSNIRKFLSGCTTGGFSKRTQFHEVS
jgi:hypothetical protein